MALYRKDLLRPNQDVQPWCIVTPAAGGGEAIANVEQAYGICVSHKTRDVLYKSNVVALNSASALLRASGYKLNCHDDTTISCGLLKEGLEAPAQNHIQVEVSKEIGRLAWVHVLNNGRAIVAPVPTPPGETADIAVSRQLFLARIDSSVSINAQLGAAALSSREVPIKIGEKAVITGSYETGFNIKTKSGDS